MVKGFRSPNQEEEADEVFTKVSKLQNLAHLGDFNHCWESNIAVHRQSKFLECIKDIFWYRWWRDKLGEKLFSVCSSQIERNWLRM